jgi:multidrug efflux pump subunit AcrA (membrane-fusion protein)
VNQKAAISLDALPNVRYDGIVTAISVTPIVKQINTGVVAYEVKISFVGNPPAEAKAGMTANVDIVTGEKKDVLLVPNKSIKRNAQGQTVVNVVVNQKTEERPVKLGLTDGSQTEVISGLQAGDTIVK